MTPFPLPPSSRAPLVALAVAALVAPFAAAHHSYGGCDADGEVALGIIEVGTGGEYTTFYVDDRNFVSGNGLWIYQESNGVYGRDLDGDGDVDPHDNLQRGGTSGGESGLDPCIDQGPWHPDGNIF